MLWFKKKPKNRRIGREYVLDVKLRSSKIRAARARAAALGLSTCFGLVLSGWLLWNGSQWALSECVYKNKAFAIRQIQVETDGVISPEQLKLWAGVKAGENLLALELNKVSRNLELLPAVKSAAIERILPNTLRIRVSEREPLAVVNVARPRAGGGLELAVFLLDEDGHVMLPLKDSQRTQAASHNQHQMPIISGINPNEVQPGKRVTATAAQAALRLIVAFGRSGMAGFADLNRIDISVPEVLVVTTGQGGEITFPLKDFDQQMARWKEVYEAAQRAGKSIAYLDLAVSNNIPARWQEVSVPSQLEPTSKPSKATPTRRKHV